MLKDSQNGHTRTRKERGWAAAVENCNFKVPL